MRCRRRLWILTWSLLPSLAILAQELPPPPEVFEFRLDDAYAQQYAVELPFDIAFKVPKQHQVFVHYPPDAGGSLIRINVATEDAPPRLIESFQITALTLPRMEDPEDRLIVLAGLLVTEGIQLAFTGRTQTRIENLRNVSSERLLAVAIDGSMVTENQTSLLVSLTGIVPRDLGEGILTVAFIDPEVSEVSGPADLARTGIVHSILSSLRLGGQDEAATP